jgi:hypothetical protein
MPWMELALPIKDRMRSSTCWALWSSSLTAIPGIMRIRAYTALSQESLRAGLRVEILRVSSDWDPGPAMGFGPEKAATQASQNSPAVTSLSAP